MGLFDFLKRDNKDEIIATPKIDLTKKINLSKEQVRISLEKKNVEKLVAEVQLAIDVSGSMSDNFDNGLVQETIDRIVPISLTFDDDGIIPTYAFDSGVKEVADLSINNLENYCLRHLNKLVGGGTNYAPTLKAILNKAKRGEMKFPAFVLFITDGENWDEYETKEVLKELSSYDVYIQFVGVGNSDFKFLKTLDNLKGRKFDNAGFIQFSNFKRFSDKDIYDELLREFIDIYKKNTFSSGKISLKKN